MTDGQIAMLVGWIHLAIFFVALFPAIHVLYRDLYGR
jgi:hypothetical protein